jgi:hypothetical protein
MRSGSNRPCALASAALLAFGLGLASCNFERNVSDDCWIDQTANADALSFRDGLRLRNVPPRDAAWSTAQARIARTRTALRACLDGAPGSGRPPSAPAAPPSTTRRGILDGTPLVI